LSKANYLNKKNKNMNITINRLNTVMADADIAEVKGFIKNIYGKMPFLIGLTTDERVTLPKISENNKVFVGDSINALVNNAPMLPSYLNVADIKNDLTLYEQLDELEMMALQLVEKIQDTRMLCGSEAYVSSLAAYRLFEAAASAGIPGADAIYDALKQRFAGQGPTGTTPPQS
jgi:hypothetical protein